MAAPPPTAWLCTKILGDKLCIGCWQIPESLGDSPVCAGEMEEKTLLQLLDDAEPPPTDGCMAVQLCLPRTRPAEDMIEGPRKLAASVQPTGVSTESVAQANGVLLQMEVQVRGTGQGAVTSPKDWTVPPLVLTLSPIR